MIRNHTMLGINKSERKRRKATKHIHKKKEETIKKNLMASEEILCLFLTHWLKCNGMGAEFSCCCYNIYIFSVLWEVHENDIYIRHKVFSFVCVCVCKLGISMTLELGSSSIIFYSRLYYNQIHELNFFRFRNFFHHQNCSPFHLLFIFPDLPFSFLA